MGAWPTLLFWGLLGLPGLLMARRLSLVDEASGALGHVAAGYLVSFGLCLPVVWLGYALSLPIEALSTWLVALAMATVAELARQRRDLWTAARLALPRWWKAPSGATLVCGGILLVDLVMAARAGAGIAGDAQFHMARVRSLHDDGFNNLDPYLTGGLFTRVYHTNVYHAVMAAGAQLTGQTPFALWVHSLPFAKLAIAAGAHALTFALARRRALAWGAAGAAVLMVAPVDFLLYPNQITPAFWLALAFAFVIELWTTASVRSAGKLALVCALLPGFHPLYAAFALALLFPLLCARTLWLMRTGKRDTAVLARGSRLSAVGLATLAVLLTLPHLLTSKWHGDYIGPAPPAYPVLSGDPPKGPPASEKRQQVDARVVRVGPFVMRSPTAWESPLGDHWLVVLGGLCGLLTRRRMAYLGLLAIASWLFALLYVPPLCTLFVRAAGFSWALNRLEPLVGTLLLWPALSGPLLMVLERLREGSVQRAAPLLAASALLAHASVHGQTSKTQPRAGYIRHALAGRAASRVARLHARRDLLSRYLKPGDTVLAGLGMPGAVTSLLPVRFVGAHRTGSAVADFHRRFRDSWSMLNERRLDAKVRRQLLAYYGVDRILLRARGERFIPRRLARHRKRMRKFTTHSHVAGRWLIFDVERE